MRLNGKGYAEKKTLGRSGKTDVPTNWRNWWLVQSHTNASLNERGFINLGTRLYLPEEYIGKRVRLKIEIIKD